MRSTAASGSVGTSSSTESNTLYFSELDAAICACWDVLHRRRRRGRLEPSGDERALLLAFEAMVEVATDLRIRPLTLGIEVDNLRGAVDQELLDLYLTLWVPWAFEPVVTPEPEERFD